VPVARGPVAVHGAILEGDLHALVGGAPRQLTPDLDIAAEALGQRVAAHPPGKARPACPAEVVGAVDRVSPRRQRRQVGVAPFERIAEYPDGRNRDVAIADRLKRALAEFGEVLTIGGLPEERLETFETEIGDLGHALGRAGLTSLDHGADADGFGWIVHGRLPSG